MRVNDCNCGGLGGYRLSRRTLLLRTDPLSQSVDAAADGQQTDGGDDDSWQIRLGPVMWNRVLQAQPT